MRRPLLGPIRRRGRVELGQTVARSVTQSGLELSAVLGGGRLPRREVDAIAVHADEHRLDDLAGGCGVEDEQEERVAQPVGAGGIVMGQVAERIGVSLSDEWQLHPEQSTSAIVVLNPRAKYFSV